MGYTKTIIKGVSWITGIRMVTRIVSFGKAIIIARILNPAQFGVFGIATLVLALVEILTETGINIFLVQRREDIDKYINTAWIVSIIRGILIAGIIFFSASVVARFFNATDSQEIIVLVSIVPIIRGFINPSVVKLQKELLFKKEFYFRTTLFLFETIISIIFVMLTKSVASLIYAMILSAALEVILSFMVIKPRPRFAFQGSLFKDIINHGKWVTGSTIFNYFYQHGDDIVVGKILGTTSLGLYDMAYRISLAPLTDFAEVIARVTFPVYVKIADDRERLRKAFLKTLLIVSLVVIPIGILFSVFAKEIISLVLGEKWLGAVPALQVLGIFGAIRAISVFSATTFLSFEKQNIFMIVSFIGLIALGVTIFPLTYHFGIFGAGLSALIGTVATLPVITYFLYKYFYNEKK